MSAYLIVDSSLRLPPDLCALSIMTKAPLPGKVKTRLVPPLTPEQAADLNVCFLRDLSAAIAQACAVAPARGVGVFTPSDAIDAYKTVLHPDFLMLPQRGESFGDRLFFAAEDLFRAGFASVCLINSDSPTVSASVFAEATNALAQPTQQVVLGPAEDGGYYLIGMTRLQRRLFEKIDWSTERVYEQTRQRADEIGLPVYELPVGFDVDDPEALKRLCKELLNEEGEAKNVAVKTRKFLSELTAQRGCARMFTQ
jgi:uncharacterized protein